MTNILIFPGTDALENYEIRKNIYQRDEIRAKILFTQKIIKDSPLYPNYNLEQVMLQDNEASPIWFKKLILCSLAAQVVIYDNYIKEGNKADFLLGISLGDIPRNVCTGVANFKEAVLTLCKFAQLVDQENAGSSYFVRLPEPLFKIESSLKFKEYGIGISVKHNEQFFLIAGPNKNLEQWLTVIGKPLKIKSKFMYPFPLHCDLMIPVAKQLLDDITKACHFQHLKIPLYSCITSKIISNEKELIEETNLNIVKPILFTKTIETILNQFEKVNFINIGPAPTMLKFIKIMNIKENNYSLTDYYQSFISNHTLN